MDRSPRVIDFVCSCLNKNALCCLFLLCFVLISSRIAFSSQEEMIKFVEKFSVQQKERKQALKKMAGAPLNEEGQKLLTHLLDETGSLEVVLSSTSYLAHIETQVATAYEAYPAYLAAMPTTELEAKTLFEFKDFLSEKVTTKEILLCMNFYFKLRKLFVNEPDIIADNNHDKLTVYLLKHFSMPLMKGYSKEELVSKSTHLMQLSTVPTTLAAQSGLVFQEAWSERLETHGSREGLLRCAITTPEEFALTRSFFENTEALEKWILIPSKSSESKKADDKKKGEKSQ